MSFTELLLYLALRGDEIVHRRPNGELWTQQGEHYIRSEEGMYFDESRRIWHRKYIWARA